MTNEVIERRKQLWLSWLELPWDSVRAEIVHQMTRHEMTREDLSYELRQAGVRVTSGTVSNWLTGRTHDGNSPPMSAMQAMVGIFAEVSMGDWSKGREVSSHDLAYAS